MSYFQGNIEMVSGVTLEALGKLVRGAVTGEQMAQPEYSGTGLLVLEPSFKHFLVLELAQMNPLSWMTACSIVHRAVFP